MVHIRYSRWNSSTRDSLDSDSVFDQLNDYMNDTGDLQQAMRRLMHEVDVETGQGGTHVRLVRRLGEPVSDG